MIIDSFLWNNLLLSYSFYFNQNRFRIRLNINYAFNVNNKKCGIKQLSLFNYFIK